MKKKNLTLAKPATLPFFPIKKIIPKIKSNIKATNIITIPEHLRAKNLLLTAWLIYFYRMGNTEPFVVRFKKLSKSEEFLTVAFNPDMQVSDASKAITQHKKVALENIPIAIIINNQLKKCRLLADSLFTVAMNADASKFRIIYNQASLIAALAPVMIKNMPGHIKTILEAIKKNPQQLITQLPLLTKAEQQKIIVDWNKTDGPFPKNKTIAELFEEQVKKTPNNIALTFAQQKLTYKELNQKANQLAYTLRKIYCGKQLNNILLGLCIERSLEMMIGILGILKSGAAYLPLDPAHPKKRLQFMLQDSQIKVVLSQKHVLKRLTFLHNNKRRVICLDSDWKKIAQAPNTNLISINRPTDLAYVIYTSGSTGTPKGVLIEHRNVANLVTYLPKWLNIRTRTRVLQFASICFDAHVWEWTSALLNGGELHLVSAKQLPPYIDVTKTLKKEKINIVTLPPIVLETMQVIKLPHLTTITSAGDVCTVQILKKWSSDRKFINAYGPTECTVCATMSDLSPHQLPNIGKPVTNTHVYVLDQYLNPLPIGTPGELYIGGVGVARGYLNRAKLTKERFIDNPLNKKERLYKTGDLVRWLPDGNLEFISRIDFQVKIRGFRIELGEIEAVLSAYPDIKQCVVLVHEKDGDKHLVAYYVAKQNRSIATDLLRKVLGKKLPDYMIPSFYVQAQTFPLTPSGKIDRNALPCPTALKLAITQEYETPHNEEEQILIKIWSEILNFDRIGINDNFFDLGGHSLKATQIATRISQVFKIDCPVKAIFENPDIARLATFVYQQLSGRKITRKPMRHISIKQPLLLSFAQQRLWFLDQYEESEQAIYNIPFAVKLIGSLDISILEKSFNYLFKRHESFRTEFKNIVGKPRQKIISRYSLKLAVKSISPNKLVAELKREAHTVFNLSKAPLIRVKLFKLAEEQHILIINQHHIISDGWSLGIFIDELNKLYDIFRRKKRPRLPTLQNRYVDFAYWQRNWLQSKTAKFQIEYWRNKLKDFTDLNLPTDFPRPPIKTYNGKHYQFLLSKELTTNLHDLARASNTTLFILLLTAFNILLARYSGQEDIIIGSPIANRNNPAIENIIGFFVNTLALRNDLSGNPSFMELLERVQQTCLDAYAHQDIPFEMLVDKLKVTRDVSRTPIFQVMFVLHDIGEQFVLSLPGIKIEKVRVAYDVAKFDLIFTLFAIGNGLGCEIEYNTDLYKSSTIYRMAQHYKVLLQSIVANPNQIIHELRLLTESEQQQVLFSWGKARKIFLPNITIQQRFEEQVRKAPNNIAVEFEERKLTYRELNYRANQLAHFLRKTFYKKFSKDLSPDTLIGLCVERSLEMIIGILGILKAGAAYVPLDPDYPKARLRFLLQDTQIKFILTKQLILQRLSFIKKAYKVVCLDTEWAQINENLRRNPKSVNNLDDLAYVIYTSGTTGQPKGVLISHKNVLRLFAATDSKYHFTPHDIWTFFHSYAFDFSVWEIWGALLHGGHLIITPYIVSRDPERFNRLLYEKAVTVLNQTPSAFYQLMNVDQTISQQHKTLRYIIFGGEALNTESLQPWWKKYGDRKPKLINMFGITETTVHATYHVLSRQDVITNKTKSIIGRKLKDLSFYVLDKYMQLVPVGVMGELYIGGDGVARGYLNRPKLSSEKFINNPFVRGPEKHQSQRLYKTGDLVSWMENGELVYLGRIDDQVKIRGFRIELGEIQSVLAKHPNVSQCLITTYELNKQQQLVAYYVPTKVKTISVDVLRDQLSRYLPDYMLPSIFIKISYFPLTATGKINRKLLPDPIKYQQTLLQKYVPPSTREEKLLAEIWSKVLAIKNISIYDNFFNIGGDSILSIRIVALVKAHGFELKVSDIFQYQSIHTLASILHKRKSMLPYTVEPYALISKKDKVKLPSGIEDAYALSSLQSGMIFHYEYSRGVYAYLDIMGYLLSGKYNSKLFRKCWKHLIKLHPILRTSFHTSGFSEPMQLVHDQITLPFAEIDLRNYSSKRQNKALQNWLEVEKSKKFNLQKAPIFRVTVHMLNKNKFHLGFTCHHSILDGWSVALLIVSLLDLYSKLINGEDIDYYKLQSNYRDFIAMEQDVVASVKQKQYWLDQVKDITPVKLPRRPFMATEKKGVGPRIVFVPITTELSNALHRIAEDISIALDNILLAAHLVVMGVLTGWKDLVTGVVFNGRLEVEDGDKVLGLFLNTLPFRIDTKNKTWINLIKAVSATKQSIYPYRRYPLVEIQKANAKGDLFEVIFNYTYFHVLEVLETNQTVQIINESCFSPTNFPLVVECNINTQTKQIEIGLVYNSAVFPEKQIRTISQYYKNALEQIVKDCSLGFTTMDILDRSELQRILVDWNKTEKPFPQDKTIHQLFEDQVRKTPDNNAVIYDKQKLTYKELNQRANQLAHYIRNYYKQTNHKELVSDTLIGICIERSIKMVIGILGILKAGAAYAPLDPDYPKERLQFILQDTQIEIVLTQKRVFEHLPFLSQHSRKIIYLDSNWQQIAKSPANTPKNINKLNDLAYVIHTSGSTGKPKGVLIEHKSLVNFLYAMRETLTLKQNNRFLAITSFSFDISGLELYSPLISGACCVIADDQTVKDPQKIKQLLAKYKINIMQATPATWQMLIDSNWKNEQKIKILCGGEALNKVLAYKLLSISKLIWNLYGPTETTIWSTVYPIKSIDKIRDCVSTGKPIANTKVYVLNEYLQLVPSGIYGELHIGGLGLARGYLNRPELTKEKFITNPFNKNERLYKTGDLVRWLPDGNLEFLGRIDFQVKIRGFRVELGEIEVVLAKHPDIRQCVVIVHEENGEKNLVAYYVSKQNKAIAADLLRTMLSKTLPDYMIPAFFVHIKAIPLTPTGKIDRKALPEPVTEKLFIRKHFVQPRDLFELQLQGIWSLLLKIAKIGIDNDFFAVGGHSLLAIRLMAEVNQQFNTNYSVAWIFQHNTIAKQASALRNQRIKAIYQPVLGFNESGTKIPLFFIHGGTSGAEVYTELAALLSKDQPFYAFESYNLYSGKPMLRSIEKLATKYIKYLRQIKAKGPYYLGGWSLGGLIAYEMAQQLIKQGQKVRVVYLLDSFDLNYEEREELLYFMKVEKNLLQRDKFYNQLPLQYRKNLKQLHQVEIESIANYKIKPYTGKVILLKAEKEAKYKITKSSRIENLYVIFSHKIFAKRDNGWEKACKNLPVRSIAGDHKSMLHGKGLKQIVKIIQQL